MRLEIKDLRVAYGKIEALKGISLTVNQGEIVSLIGANGAGKTTLLKTISGLLNPTSGSIEYDGKSILGEKAHRRVHLGISQAPEGRGIFPGLTVLENLELGTFHLKSTKSDMQEDLEKVYELFPRLKERMTQTGGTLSGGEQQMLAIGRALMAKPKVLLLDEPTNHLDIEGVSWLAKHLRKRRELAVIVVTHDRWFLDRVCTHMLAYEGDGTFYWFEGNFADYEENLRQRKGESALRRNKYRDLSGRTS